MKRLGAEKRIHRQVIYQGRILKLWKDLVQGPDRQRFVREVVGHAPAAAVVPLLPSRQVVLVRQYRHAIGQALWEIPAGLLKSGERPRQAASRELLEETGYGCGQLGKLAEFYSSPGFSQERIYLYAATDLAFLREPRIIADEFVTTGIFTYTRVMQMVDRGTIQDGKTILGLVLARNLLCR